LAARAVDTLVDARFSNADITVLFPQNRDSNDFAHRKRTRAPEGTAIGATASVALDGTLGFRDPAHGPHIGALTGALAGMGIPEDEAERYGNRVKAGGVLFSVVGHTSDEVMRLTQLLRETGAEDISSTDGKAVRSERT
jgi:hypothetical protein